MEKEAENELTEEHKELQSKEEITSRLRVGKHRRALNKQLHGKKNRYTPY